MGLFVAVPAQADEDPKSAVAEKLARQLVRVPSNERRSELLEEMIVHADGHNPSAFILRDALLEIWSRANKRLGAKQGLRGFKGLVKARKELVELRRSTLEIIRDKDRYPYPCKPPEASPEAVAAFKASQREIDVAVERMRELWHTGPTVEIPSSIHKHLELAQWAVRAKKRASQELGVGITFPAPDLPSWVYGLPLKGEVEGNIASVQVMGLSLEAQKGLAKSRAIRTLNRRLRDEALEGGSGEAQSRFEKKRLKDEFRQVEHTNDYRELFGLHALAWDAKLFEACRQHADYLWESGEFTHFQPDAEFHTFMARAQHAGYTERVYENCHKGSNDPFDAHDALCHSSEHHRTILLQKAHEMATARSGLVWVQNYGLDTGFHSTIQWGAWRD